MSTPTVLEILSEWESAQRAAGRARATTRVRGEHLRAVVTALAAGEDCDPAELRLTSWTRSALRAHLCEYREGPDRRFQESAPARTRSSSSVAGRLGAIRALTAFAVAEGHLAPSPALTLPLVSTQTTRDALSLEEARAVIAAAASSRGGRDAVLVALALTLGCSVSEIAGLRRDDLAATTVRVRGKRRRDGSEPVRVLALPEHARAVCATYVRSRAAVLGRGGEDRPELVLCGSSAGEQRVRSCAAAIRRVMLRAGIDSGRAHSHVLRTTHARLAWEAGASAKELAESLGLRSLSAVQALVGAVAEQPVGVASHPLARG